MKRSITLTKGKKMGQRTIYVDDISGKEGEDIKPRKFSLGQRKFVIDLSDENYAEMKDAFEKYFKAGRADTGATAPAASKPKSAPAYNRAEFNEWAADNGHEVSKAGRPKQALVDQFLAFKNGSKETPKEAPKAQAKADAKK